MKKLLLALFLLPAAFVCMAQNTLYESFNRDAELMEALKQYNFNGFITDPVTFTYDTLERTLTAEQVNQWMKLYFKPEKKSIVKKAAETNNGYTQTYGIYKDDIAVLFARFEFYQENMMLKEIVLERN
ncbi:MAG: hypothetical protein ACK45I_03665 [Bacteroidota bacterium]|jgi:hypothetical protein